MQICCLLFFPSGGLWLNTFFSRMLSHPGGGRSRFLPTGTAGPVCCPAGVGRDDPARHFAGCLFFVGGLAGEISPAGEVLSGPPESTQRAAQKPMVSENFLRCKFDTCFSSHPAVLVEHIFLPRAVAPWWGSVTGSPDRHRRTWVVGWGRVGAHIVRPPWTTA